MERHQQNNMSRLAQPKNHRRVKPKPLPKFGAGQRVNATRTPWDLHDKQMSGKLFNSDEEYKKKYGQWNG